MIVIGCAAAFGGPANREAIGEANAGIQSASRMDPRFRSDDRPGLCYPFQISDFRLQISPARQCSNAFIRSFAFRSRSVRGGIPQSFSMNARMDTVSYRV